MHTGINTRKISEDNFVFIGSPKTWTPSITDGVHRNENAEEIIPVFSTFSNFFKQNKKKL